MRPCLQTFSPTMDFRAMTAMSQRCVYHHVRPGQLYCARWPQTGAVRRIKVLHSGSIAYPAQSVCRSSHGAPILERSGMQQPSSGDSDGYGLHFVGHDIPVVVAIIDRMTSIKQSECLCCSTAGSLATSSGCKACKAIRTFLRVPWLLRQLSTLTPLDEESTNGK